MIKVGFVGRVLKYLHKLQQTHLRPPNSFTYPYRFHLIVTSQQNLFYILSITLSTVIAMLKRFRPSLLIYFGEIYDSTHD